MPTFTYRTISGVNGSRANGTTIEAPDRASAVRELLRRGVTPSAVEPVIEGGHLNGRAADRARAAALDGAAKPAEPLWTALRLSRPAMNRAEMASFVRELATAVGAGLPLVLAMRTLARQGRSERQRAMLDHLIHQVEHGKSLAEAAASWGAPFTDLTVNMIRSGEASGRLAEVLDQSADLMDRDLNLRRSVLSATLYPLILLVLIIVAVIVIVTFIMPTIMEKVEIPPERLPIPTRMVQGVANLFSGYWWLILPGVLIGYLMLVKYMRQPLVRLRADTILLKLPLLGALLKDVAVARFTRTLGTLTSAGVPVLQALRITKGTLSNKAMEGVIDTVVEQVAAGKTIAEPMERSGYFPPMLVQIVNLGERTGRLDEMLRNAAKAFEERTEMSLKLFTTALPPILVVIMACMVGFVILAMLLPLLEMQDAILRQG